MTTVNVESLSKAIESVDGVIDVNIVVEESGLLCKVYVDSSTIGSLAVDWIEQQVLQQINKTIDRDSTSVRTISSSDDSMFTDNYKFQVRIEE